MIEEDLLDLKRDIDEAKTKVAELNGQVTALLRQLKEEWKCSSIQEAEEKLRKLDLKITSIQKEIDKGCAELEEKYLNVDEE